VTHTKWQQVANRAAGYSTPFFLIWAMPFLENHQRLQRKAESIGPFRQWYSFKSQPVPQLALFAATLGMGIEVVSELELLNALKLNFAPENILVNGLAKHAWLTQKISKLNVIFDSIYELTQLAKTASMLNWCCGLRVAVSGQINVEEPGYPVQFGIDSRHLGYARDLLADKGMSVEVLHFHLRSNVPSPLEYERVLEELAFTAKALGISPKVIDLGGGLPDWSLGSSTVANRDAFLDEYAALVRLCRERFSSVSDVWAENGRYLLGPTGILVVTILDIKEISDIKVLICDGGRANQALPSNWESHQVALLNADPMEDHVETVVCGPTCMADDCFYRGLLPRSARIGDRLVYYNAGAYHISWENRFSNGLCKVLWTIDGMKLTLIRPAETSMEWASRWKAE
jgi:diaminopimelate decarboxylase